MPWASYTHGRLIPPCILVTSLWQPMVVAIVWQIQRPPPQLSVQIWTPPWRVARSKRPREAIGYPPPTFRARHMELFPSLRIVTSLKCLTFFPEPFSEYDLSEKYFRFYNLQPIAWRLLFYSFYQYYILPHFNLVFLFTPYYTLHAIILFYFLIARRILLFYNCIKKDKC